MAKTRKVMKPVKQPAANESIENDADPNDDVFEVERILDKKESSKGLEYYVKWKGYPAAQNTWEPAENIIQEEIVKEFEQRQAKQAKRNPRKKDVEVEDGPAEEDEDEAGDDNVEEEEEDEDLEEAEEEAEEPVKPKRARTASKAAVAAKKAPAARSKAQAKDKKTPENAESTKSAKIKMPPLAKRAAEPKAKRAVEPKAEKTASSRAKPRATPIEPKKAPTKRNVTLKRTAAAAAKDTNMDKPQEDEDGAEDGELDEEKVEDMPDLPMKDKEETLVNGFSEEIDFSEFKLVRLIEDSLLTKTVTFLGTYNGDSAVLRLEKTVFNEDAVKEALSDKDTIKERDFLNDIYSSYIFKPSNSLNDIKATVVCPADKSVLAKYTRDETILFSETPDVYSKVIEPFIEGILSSASDPNRWIYNILDGKSETERVIFNDPDPNSGFMLVPDLKWGGDVKDLNLVAICHRRDIRSLRDLNEKHLILLNNIMTKGTKTIKDEFKNIEGQLRSFIHYQPSFYHFHVHFKVVDAYEYRCSDRDNLLATVINNITLKKDYYKKSVLIYPLSKSRPLYQELERANRI